MATKDKVKKLLEKDLTGWEAGLLVFQDSWEVDHDREGFLSKADIQALKSRLISQKDMADYNRLIHLYRSVDYMNKGAIGLLTAACCDLERIAGLGFIAFGSYMGRMAANKMPLIVTEKQLQDLKARQKKKAFKQLHCLDEVISWRAWHAAKEGDLPDDWYLETIGDDAPELYQQAEAEIAGLVEAGTLKPVKLKIQASDKEATKKRPEIEYWLGDSTWSEEKATKYLQTYFSGEQLYAAGLPEWRSEIDTLQTWDLPEEEWLGDDPPDSYAIIQEPEESDLDKRGYYKARFLSHWPLKKNDPLLAGMDDQILAGNEIAIEGLRRLLASRQVLEEASKIVHVDLTEDIRLGIGGLLEPSLGRYNMFAQELSPEIEKILSDSSEPVDSDKWKQDLKAMEHSLGNAMAIRHMAWPKYRPLKLEKIRPLAEELREKRSWISEHLGDGWWKASSPGSRQEEEEEADNGKT